MGSSDVATLADSLRAIRERIIAATQSAGRAADSVRLVAVSKTRPQSEVLAALAEGQTVFGENRVQEAAGKFGGLRASHTLELHLIGGIQTNKAMDAVMLADVIETLDRPAIVDAVIRASDKAGRLPKLLVQVNIGEEPQKSGVALNQADGFIEACQRQFGELLRGLMCVPPAAGDPEPHFRKLATLAARHGLPELSMGMSNDFEQAIACGATILRIGSALFGARAPIA